MPRGPHSYVFTHVFIYYLATRHKVTVRTVAPFFAYKVQSRIITYAKPSCVHTELTVLICDAKPLTPNQTNSKKQGNSHTFRRRCHPGYLLDVHV